MSLHTVSNPLTTPDRSVPVIALSDVGVRYRTAQERIPSIKEYAVRWLRREIRIEEFWALQEINLRILPGEVLGIIGPNGAGKSTLLKVIARVLRPTRGRVQINGRVSPLLELGAGFDPELTGRENVYLNSAILGYSKRNIDERFDRIVEFAGLRDFVDAPVRTYSTGMTARLGFAVATDVRPEILIVDEILGVGDSAFQTKSFERIQSFQAAGTTILLVSHSLDRVLEMCSRSIWLDQGRLMAEGSTEMVVGKYLEADKANAAKLLASSDSESENRWGNQKIEITNVRILDEAGQAKRVFKTGQSFAVEMTYEARQPVSSPIFGLALYHHDGSHITGPNTETFGLKLPMLAGKGKIRYSLPALPLLDGLYHLSVAAVNEDDTEVYDFHSQAYDFRILNSEQSAEPYGVVALGGSWEHLNE